MTGPSDAKRAVRSRPARRVAVAAVVLWIGVLSGLFALLEAPDAWIQVAARAVPGIWEARSAALGIVYRDYAY